MKSIIPRMVVSTFSILNSLFFFCLFVFALSPCNRTVGAAEGSGHSSGEELAGDLGERGDHDGGFFPESVPGSGQDEGGTNYHRLWDREAHWHPEKGINLFDLSSLCQNQTIFLDGTGDKRFGIRRGRGMEMWTRGWLVVGFLVYQRQET